MTKNATLSWYAGWGILLCCFLWQNILNGLNIYFVPKVSWAAGAFANESPLFISDGSLNSRRFISSHLPPSFYPYAQKNNQNARSPDDSGNTDTLHSLGKLPVKIYSCRHTVLILFGANLYCELYKRVLRIDQFTPYLIENASLDMGPRYPAQSHCHQHELKFPQ